MRVLAGGDSRRHSGASGSGWLRSTPPSREATLFLLLSLLLQRVAIHAPLAGGDSFLDDEGDPRQVAIHAPLAGGDTRNRQARRHQWVAIHAPLAGGDSTRSPRPRSCRSCDPRPPRGRRLGAAFAGLAPLASCDPRPPRGRRPLCMLATDVRIKLRSTPPSREATLEGPHRPGPRQCCDPRPPRGRRQLVEALEKAYKLLRSTPPSREATRRKNEITALRMLRSTPPSREATS